jgi:hypothetical protein
MEGTLRYIEESFEFKQTWIIQYWGSDPHYHGSPGSFRQIIFSVEVHPISLEDLKDSNVLIDGTNVKFNIVDNYGKIIHMNDELSHENILKIIKMFGLEIETDYWETINKRYIRVVSNEFIYDYNDNGYLIIYKDDGYYLILKKLQLSLIKTGENIKSREIRKTLNLE